MRFFIPGLHATTAAGYFPTLNAWRRAADSFLVIATIERGSGVVYADTLTWSLAADTEDTVSFKEFKPSDASNYTLTASTLMTTDESDEDDKVLQWITTADVNEPVTPVTHPSLDVARNTPSSLLVSYSLPLGEQGTISLYDPTGRRIESLTVTGSGSINLKSNLSSGVYFVKLETGSISLRSPPS